MATLMFIGFALSETVCMRVFKFCRCSAEASEMSIRVWHTMCSSMIIIYTIKLTNPIGLKSNLRFFDCLLGLCGCHDLLRVTGTRHAQMESLVCCILNRVTPNIRHDQEPGRMRNQLVDEFFLCTILMQSARIDQERI